MSGSLFASSLPVVSPNNTSGAMDQDGQAWLMRDPCVSVCVCVSSCHVDLVTRCVPLSVFTEVARGVAGEIAGGMDEWRVCV